ncbi:LA2681 family HEPN domain-containing protein [Burkholderia thailandensis]|uniref:LA2681 family HEPN domain-containing protein n=1 Tax=Burkholderia thailandensis TaxID=57975 RepID=UPI0002FFF33E|nr:LA2681 family HEPN domain-containing protein [Burkholderia thailandensis]
MTISNKQFAVLAGELKNLLDSEASDAISHARALAAAHAGDGNLLLLVAGTLVDAGKAARDLEAVEEGIKYFETLVAGFPEHLSIAYNLANGLIARANLSWTAYPDWYLQTMHDRARARRLYAVVATADVVEEELRAQAHTNLAVMLADAYRYSEAYDNYSRALELDPINGVARVNAARLLLRFAREGANDNDAMHAVAVHHLKVAKQNPARIRELVSEADFKKLAELFDQDLPAVEVPDLSGASDYQRFVAEHRLFLADTIEGLDASLTRWDTLRLDGISDGPDAVNGPPPVFAMFNILKADYLAARHMAFLALTKDVTDSGSYSDTCDGALYGVANALMTLAQRACLDVLDKVAVLASAYLKLPVDPQQIYFRNVWFEPSKRGEPLRWKETICSELTHGNTALIALSELARDISEGGYLELKKAMRHASTHRFAVLHDGKPDIQRKSAFIEHYARSDFVNHLVDTLQMARAAINYVARMIARHEAIHDDGTPKTELDIREFDPDDGDS